MRRQKRSKRPFILLLSLIIMIFGSLYLFKEFFKKDNGTNDNNETIISYWTTPMDNFGYNNQLKTTNKRGGIAKIKTIQNGIIKLARKTDKSEEFKYVTQKSATGFSFVGLNF